MKKNYILGLAIVLLFTLNIKAQVDLNSGLIAFYPFNGNALDSSGKGNNGTIYGAVSTSDRFGIANSAYSFNGSTDYFSNSTVFTTAPTSFSVSWWLNQNMATNWGAYFGSAINWGGFIFHSTENAEIYVGTDVNNRLTPTELGSGSVTLNTWQNFTFTFENGVGSLYKDGLLLASKGGMLQPIAWNGIATQTGTNSISGYLDDIRVYKRALNANEVQALYNEIPFHSLVGNTVLCKGNGTTLSVNAPNATSVKWDNETQSNSSTSVSPTADTYYYCTISYPEKTVYDSVLVKVYDAVSVSELNIKASQTTMCKGDAVTLTATGATYYKWDNGTIGNTIQINPSVSSYFYVTPNGCSLRDSIYITVNEKPNLEIVPNKSNICVGDPVTITASGADDLYKWSTGETTPTVTLLSKTGNYFTLTATNANGCSVVVNSTTLDTKRILKSIPSVTLINSSTVDHDGNIWIINDQNKVEISNGTTFTQYIDPNNNLSYSSAYSITTDRNGFVWLSTNVGLYRYNGTWSLSSFPNNNLISAGGDINSIYADSKGNVWVLFYYYDPGMSGFLNYSLSGLFKFDGSSWDKILVSSGSITSFTIDANGTPWIIENNGSTALYEYTLESWNQISTDNYYSIGSSVISSDSQGNIWYTATDNNLVKTDGSSFTEYIVPNSDTYNSVFIDNKNTVWLSCGSKGLSSFENGKWINFTIDNSLINNSISGIYQDSSGVIYAQASNGISELGIGLQINQLPQASISTTVNANSEQIIIASGGTNYLWNTSEKTAQIVSNEPSSTKYSVTVSNQFGCSVVESIVASALRVSNNLGVVCEGSSIELTASGVDSYVWSTGETTPSIIVTATSGCLYSVTGTDANGLKKVEIISDNGGKSWSTLSNTTGDHILSSAVDFQGNDWAVIDDGNGNQNLYKYDGSNFSEYSNQSLQYTSASEVLEDPHGYIWLITDAGLFKFNGIIWENKFSQLPIKTVDFDKNGNVWLATHVEVDEVTTTSKLFYSDGKTWTDRTPSFAVDGIKSLTIDSYVNPWIVYNNEADPYLPYTTVARFDGQSWSQLSQFNSDNGISVDGYIDADQNGNVYISSGGTLYKTDGNTTTQIEIPNHNLSSYEIGDIEVDKNNAIWVTYPTNDDWNSRLLSKYENGEWSTFDSQNSGINAENGYSLHQDNAGNLYSIGVQLISKYGSSLQVKPLPIPVVISKRVNGQEILKASGGSHYEWETGELIPMIVANPSTSTMYHLTVASDYGCTANDSVVASTVEISYDKKEVCEATVLILTANGADSYAWSTGETGDKIVVTVTPGCNYSVTGTNSFGIAAFDSVQDKSTKVWMSDNIESSISSSTIDKQGNMWAIVASEGNVLLKKDASGMQWYQYEDPNEDLSYNNPQNIATDANGYVWLNTSSGVFRYDGLTWQKMYDQESWELQPDRNGGMTILTGGPGGGGMDMPASFSLPTPQTSLDASSTTNNPAGLYKFNGQQWQNITPDFISNPYDDIYYSTLDSKGNIWVTYYNSSENGNSPYQVTKYDGQTWEQIDNSNYSKGLDGGLIVSDSKGNVYIQGVNVIYKTDGDSWSEIPFYNETSNTCSMNSMYIDKNDVLWASFYSGIGFGLSKYTNGTWETYNSEKDGLSDNSVLAIYESAEGDLYAQGNQSISKNGYPFQVNSLPISKITAFPATMCTSQPVVLNATGAAQYIWATTDTKSQITVNPIVTTTYPVQLISDKGCIVKDSIKVTIPKVVITVSKDTICSDEKIVLKASGALSYMWSNGIQKDSIEVSPKVTTTYKVFASTEFGCSLIDSVTIIVNHGPALVIQADPTAICQTSTATISVSGGDSYIWNNGETSDMFDESPLSSKYYTVSSTSINGCTTVDSVNVTVNAIPTLSITATSGTICKGSSTSLNATGGKTIQWGTGEKNRTISVHPSDTAKYFATILGSNGCSANDSITIAVNQLPTIFAIASQSSVCQGDSIVLTGNGSSIDYIWSNTVTNNAWYKPTVSQIYTVTGIDINGCSNSASTKVIVNVLPTVTTTVSTSQICDGEEVTVFGVGAKVYNWDNNVTNAVSFKPTKTKPYTVEGVDSNGCKNTAIVSIVVNALPTVTATTTKLSICSGDTIKLIGGGAETYVWDNVIFDSQLFVPTANQTYTVTGTDLNGCSNIDSIAIEVTIPTIPVVKSVTMLVNGTVPILTATGNDVKWYDQSETTLLATGNTYSPVVDASKPAIYAFNVTNSEKVCETKPVVVYISISDVSDIPYVTITSPVADSYIPLSSVLTIQADASKLAGTIDSVVFYAKAAKIGVATTAPYAFDWVVEGSGLSEITAIAYDNSGASATTVNTFWINEAPYLTQGSIPEQIAQKDTSFAPIDLAAFVTDSYTAVTDLNITFETNPYLAISFINGKLVAKQLDSSWSGTTPIFCKIVDAQGMELQLPIMYTQPYLMKSLKTKPTGGFYANKMLLKVNEQVRFYTSVIAADTVIWNFGGGVQTSGTDINPVVKYQNPGVYSISMNVINAIGDTIIIRKNYIIVSALSVFDTVLCKGSSMTIAASSGFTSYVWNTNPIQTTASITVAPIQTTMYKVTMKKGLATVIDSVVVTIPKQPELGNDTTFCEGGSKRLTAGIFNSYFWNESSTNGLPYFDAMHAGKVKVRTIDAFGCSASDSMIIGTLYPKPLLNLGKDSTFCWKKKLTLNAGNIGAKYIWNTGAKTQTIIADTTRLYSVTVTDSKSCVNSDTIAINVLVPLIPKIGLVTLSDAGYNLIAWEPQQNRGIAMYHVWKESNTAGTFAIIDTIYKNDTTVSIDKKSTPKVKSSTYALSIVDSACGIESGLSPIHNSIHLSCVLQQNGTVKATWNNYVGLVFTKYIIFRAVKGQKLQAYDTVDFNPNATQMQYIDENAIGLNSYYQVGFVLPQQINLSKLKSDSGPFSQSLSNMAESELTDVAITSIDATITVFPNPNNGQFTISIASEKAKRYTIELVNELGQILLEKQTVEVTEAKLQIDASNFGSGVYLLKVISKDGIATKQIVITQ